MGLDGIQSSRCRAEAPKNNKRGAFTGRALDGTRTCVLIELMVHGNERERCVLLCSNLLAAEDREGGKRRGLALQAGQPIRSPVADKSREPEEPLDHEDMPVGLRRWQLVRD